MPGLSINTLPDGVTPINGVSIQSSDGATTIIDGTTDVFKIAASGTQSQAVGAGATATATVTLPALGAFTTPPAFVMYVADSVISSTTRQMGSNPTWPTWTTLWVATLNGGATNHVMTGPYDVVSSFVSLDGSSNVVVSLMAISQFAAITGYQRYYILLEVGI